MREDIVFYHNPNSRSRIVHLMLEELGVPYRVELVDLEKKQQKAPKYKAINPMGKIPTIIHRDTVITESAAICAYLADAYPAKKLAPALDDPARATYLRWLFFSAGCVEPAIVDKLVHRPMPDSTNPLGYGCYEDMVEVLEKALGRGPFILGERFTAVDVHIGSEIEWGIMAHALDPRPRFQLYLEKIRARPAYARVVEQSARFNAELAGQTDTKESKKSRPRSAAPRA